MGARPAVGEDLTRPELKAAPFTADYVNFMKQVTPETTQEYMQQLKRFNMGSPGESDCPVFDGMYEYFAVSQLQVVESYVHWFFQATLTHVCLMLQLLSGGSVDGAAFLAEGKADIAFNWSGRASELHKRCQQLQPAMSL